jgi:RND family efflux transporter MFP subunit
MIKVVNYTPIPKLFFAILLFSFLALSSTACKSGYPVSANKSVGTGDPKAVTLLTVEQKPLEQLVTAMGTLAAYEEATISAKVPGRIRAMNIDLGSIVRAGQVIADLEPRDAQLAVEQAEAALAQARARLGLDPSGTDENVKLEQTATVRQAKATLDDAEAKLNRAKALFQQGVIAKAQLETAEADYKVALSRYQDSSEEIRNRQAVLLQRKSEVEIARQRLKDLSIKAAFDGMVKERRANLGEYVSSGSPIATIVKVDPLRLRVEVPERNAKQVRSGQLVRVSIEGDANTYTGRIVRISPSISAQNRILLVEAEVRNNGQLKPGAFARADIVTDAGTMAIAIPQSAVVTFAGIEKVITVQDGKAVEKPITTGRKSGDLVEVLTGIKAGEQIVVQPGNLQSGQPVIIQ